MARNLGFRDVHRIIQAGRYFVQGFQGVSSKASKVLSLELPKYFTIGFPQGLSRISKVLLAGIPRGFIQDVRGYRVFIQALKFPRIFKVFLYTIPRFWYGISEVLMRYFQGWKGVRKMIRGAQVRQQLNSKKVISIMFLFFYFWLWAMS